MRVFSVINFDKLEINTHATSSQRVGEQYPDMYNGTAFLFGLGSSDFIPRHHTTPSFIIHYATTADIYSGPTSNTAGPAATVSSVTVVLQPVSTTYVWPEIGAVPFGAVGTVTVKPPSTAVALQCSISKRLCGQRMSNGSEKDLRSKDGASNCDESAVDLRFAIRGSDDVPGCQKGDFGTGGDVAIVRRGDESRESLRRVALTDDLCVLAALFFGLDIYLDWESRVA